MLHIDALSFLLLGEAFVLSLSLSAYLYYRLRKDKRNASLKALRDAAADPASLLRDLMRKYQSDITKLGEQDDASDEGPLRKEKQSLSLKFLTVSMDGLSKHDKRPDLFWEHIYRGYEEIMQDLINTKNALALEKDLLCDKLKAAEDTASQVTADRTGDGDNGRLQTENEQMKADIKRLEENVEAKARTNTDLQAKFEALEKEYLVLY